jgi:serine phosphatase RsbU (regulator of sigma subunit)
VGEPGRLGALRRSGLLDTAPEESFDRLTRIAAASLNVPVALVSLVDEDRQFFKSCLGLPEPWAGERETPLSHSFCRHVVDRAQPLVVDDARDHPALRDNPAISDLGVIAYAGFPLLSPGGEVLGSLCAIDTSPRAWSKQDLEMLGDIAQAAMTELRLRFVAEEAADALTRLARLESITDAALNQLRQDELLTQMVARIAAALDADTATVLLRDGNDLAVRAAVGLEQEVAREVRVPIGTGFAGRVAAEGRPLTLADVGASELVSPVLRDEHPVAMLGVPLSAEGETIGVLHVGSFSPRAFGPSDVDLLSLAADRLSRAISTSQKFEREHEIAQTLQRSALPAHVPQLSGYETSVRYLPAGRATHVGGDWYDVFSLGGRRAGISVGDIAGHGIPAAAEMNRIRSALQAYLFDAGDPVEALRKLDRLLLAGAPGKMATAVAMTLDADTRTALLAVAGHPPPVLLVPGREPRVIEHPGGMPLGIVAAPPRPEALQVELPAGATLLLYSDGLVERRDEPIDQSIERLTRVAANAPPEVEAFSDHVIAQMLGGAAPADDVALLTVRCA